MKRKKVAILGTGFCGLACAYYLIQRVPNIEICFFDSNEIGDNASGCSAGLLHAFTGKKANLSPIKKEGLNETLKLLQLASQSLGFPTYHQMGMLRLALDPEQNEHFIKIAKEYPQVKYYPPLQTQKILKSHCHYSSIFYKEAWHVDTKNYLFGLWRFLKNYQVKLIRETVYHLKVFNNYDACIIAAGAKTAQLAGLASIKTVKGQLLKVRWPKKRSLPNFLLNANLYMIPDVKNHICTLGATFEKQFITENADENIACKELLPKLEKIFGDCCHLEVLECIAGLRATTFDHKPLSEKINENTYVITGMGSKGLLYHALTAKNLINEVYKNTWDE